MNRWAWNAKDKLSSKRSTKGGAPSCFSFESGPNPARPLSKVQAPPGEKPAGRARAILHAPLIRALSGDWWKVMQERSEMRFLHHFLRGRRGDWDEMPEGERRYVMLGSRKPGLGHYFFYLSEIKVEGM